MYTSHKRGPFKTEGEQPPQRKCRRVTCLKPLECWNWVKEPLDRPRATLCLKQLFAEITRKQMLAPDWKWETFFSETFFSRNTPVLWSAAKQGLPSGGGVVPSFRGWSRSPRLSERPLPLPLSQAVWAAAWLGASRLAVLRALAPMPQGASRFVLYV